MFPSLIQNDCFLKRIPGKRIYDMSSLNLKNIANFIRINSQQKSKTIIEDLTQIINLKTSNRLQSVAKQLAQIGKFFILQPKQGLFRPGESANKYYIILNGKIGLLIEQQLLIYDCGQGIGDEQFYLEQKYRLGYAFTVSTEQTLICQITKADYYRIFTFKLQIITKYEQILKTNCNFFHDLPKNKIKLILKDSQIFNLKKNEIIFEKYENVKGIYILLEGKAKQIRQVKYKSKSKFIDHLRRQVKDFKNYVQMYQQLTQITTMKQKIFQYVPYTVLGLEEIQNLKNRRNTKVQMIKQSKILYIPLFIIQRYQLSPSNNLKLTESHKKDFKQVNIKDSTNKIKNYKSQRRHTLEQYQSNQIRMNTLIPKNKCLFFQ